LTTSASTARLTRFMPPPPPYVKSRYHDSRPSARTGPFRRARRKTRCVASATVTATWTAPGDPIPSLRTLARRTRAGVNCLVKAATAQAAAEGLPYKGGGRPLAAGARQACDRGGVSALTPPPRSPPDRTCQHGRR